MALLSTMYHRITEHKTEISDLCRVYGVARLDVFGSASRVDDFDPASSDVDFLMVLKSERDTAFTMTDYLDFRNALSHLVGRPVDLVMDGSVRNPYVQADIERSRVPVHAA